MKKAATKKTKVKKTTARVVGNVHKKQLTTAKPSTPRKPQTKTRPDGYTFGRPTSYRSEYCALIIERMREGTSLIEVACEIGVLRGTLHNWAAHNQDFSDALKKGLELSEAWWTEKGHKSLSRKYFNTALWFINMKNRFGWRDQPKDAGISPEEVARAVKAALSALDTIAQDTGEDIK